MFSGFCSPSIFIPSLMSISCKVFASKTGRFSHCPIVWRVIPSISAAFSWVSPFSFIAFLSWSPACSIYKWFFVCKNVRLFLHLCKMNLTFAKVPNNYRSCAEQIYQIFNIKIQNNAKLNQKTAFGKISELRNWICGIRRFP